MHQGFSWPAHNIPPNTIPSLLGALDLGFDGMETDIRKTSDGVWVISHNSTVDGTINGTAVSLSVSDSTLAQLKAVVLGTSTEYGETHIATLQELCQTAAYTGMRLLLEYKGGANPGEIAEVVMMSGMQGRVIYMCSHTYWSQFAAIDHNASFAEVIFGLGTVTDFSPYTVFLNGSNTVGLDYQATTNDANNPDMTNVILAQKAGLSIDFWNISGAAHNAYFDINPRAITVNGSDVFTYLATYLDEKQSALPGPTS